MQDGVLLTMHPDIPASGAFFYDHVGVGCFDVGCWMLNIEYVYHGYLLF